MIATEIKQRACHVSIWAQAARALLAVTRTPDDQTIY
jgi:hypothetical protein